MKKRMTVMAIESFNGTLYANILDQLFALKEIPEREKVSNNFDTDNDEIKLKNLYSTKYTSLEACFLSCICS